MLKLSFHHVFATLDRHCGFFAIFLMIQELDPNIIELLRKLKSPVCMHVKCFCRVLNPIKATLSLVIHTRLYHHRVILLYTPPFIDAQNFLIFFTASPQEPQLYIPGLGVISLSSQVRNSFSCLKYIENLMVQVKSRFRYYKSLSFIMYVFVREEFSFDRLYYLCFGIFLNKCYVSTLGLYQFFGLVNFNY